MWIDRGYINADRPELYDDRRDFLQQIEQAYGDEGSTPTHRQRAGVLLSQSDG